MWMWGVPDNELHLLNAMRSESRSVLATLKALDRTNLVPEIQERHADVSGRDPGLSWQAFHDVVPEFPVYCEFRFFFDLDKNRRSELTTLLRAPQDTVMAQKYEAVRTAALPCANGRPVAMLFPFGRIRSGLVLHDAERLLASTKSSCGELRWGGPGNRRILQPFRSFLSALCDADWTVGGSDSSPRLTIGELLRSVRDSNELRVILALSSNPLPITRIEGHRWVLCRREVLAAAAGLSLDQLKGATQRLERRGLVARCSVGRVRAYRITTAAVTIEYRSRTGVV